ncbi:MAG: hypothetical protein J6T10_15700 [Methanobrevibacter sp.]|nr:hypothetical protein [Methanobrevibacter sp.]
MKLKDIKVEYEPFLTGQVPVKIGDFEVTERSSIELLMPNGDLYVVRKEKEHSWSQEERPQLIIKKAGKEYYEQLYKAPEVNWNDAEIVIIKTDISRSTGRCYESSSFCVSYSSEHNIRNYTQEHEYDGCPCGYESNPCGSKFKELGLDLGVQYRSWCDSSD